MTLSLKVGSRGSDLAVAQAEAVIKAIRDNNPDASIELVKIKTTGDMAPDDDIAASGGKGLFVRELEHALEVNTIDIAVHSYKDMPLEDNAALPVVALSERESPFDALVLPEGALDIDAGKPVGTSSLRRAAQFKKLYNGYEIAPVRGNIATRLSKLDNGLYSALVLAQAGLNRLGLRHRISRVFAADEMVPAGSQGIIAVQGRRGENHSYLDGFRSRRSETVSRAERSFLKALGASCSAPVGVYAEIDGNSISVTGMYSEGAGRIETGCVSGSAGDAELLGEIMAIQLKKRFVN